MGSKCGHWFACVVVSVLAGCSATNNGRDGAGGANDAQGSDSTANNGSDSGSDLGLDSIDTVDPLDGATDTDTAVPPDDVPVGVDAPAPDVAPLLPVVDILGPGAPSDAPTRFGGSPDANRDPSLVYPDDGTIIPYNLSGFEIHFMPGTGNDLYRLTLVGPGTTVNIYTTCTPVGGGCVYSFDDTNFETIARAAQTASQLTLTVSGTSAAGGSVGTSAARTLGVTSQGIRGGIYYWAAGSTAVVRYEFGLPGAHRENYMAGSTFNCIGCHALARDGSRIGIGRFGFGFTLQTYDTAPRTAIGGTMNASFGSYSPDNARLLGSDGARLTLYDTATGTPATGLSGSPVGSMPDWSPDGAHAVYSQPASPPGSFVSQPGHTGAADLMVMDWSGTAFGAARTVFTSSGENNFYPAFSPDNQWIIFNRATGTSFNNPAASLWAVPAAGGTGVHLAAADLTGMHTNSWPKWAPFQQVHRGGPLMWFTFSTVRPYGLRGGASAQLWMAAFRPGMAATDPSVPAFWLPFQDFSTGNHIAQWTAQVRRTTCQVNSDCGPNEHCLSITAQGVCVGN